MLTPTQRKKACAAAILLACGGYGVYRLARSDRASKTLKSVKRLILAGWNVAEALSCAAELSSSALVDLKEFLESQDDEVPGSVKQLCKFLGSREVCAAARALSSAVVEGAGNAGLDESSIQPGVGVADRLLLRAIDAFLSDRGRNLVSLAMSVAARNSVRSLCECLCGAPGSGMNGVGMSKSMSMSRPDLVLKSFIAQVIDVLSTDKGEKVIGAGISAFARSFVAACLDGVDVGSLAEGILGAMSRPGNAQALIEIAGASSREAVSSLVTATRLQLSQGQAMSQSPPSVSVNNLDEDGSLRSNSPSMSPRTPVTSVHPSLGKDKGQTPFQNPTSWDRDPPSSSSSSSSLQPLADALITFCKIPEARNLAVALAGSAAREGARGVVLSVPEVTSSIFTTMGHKFKLDFGAETGPFSVQAVCTWLVVLMSVILYMTTRSLTIGT